MEHSQNQWSATCTRTRSPISTLLLVVVGLSCLLLGNLSADYVDLSSGRNAFLSHTGIHSHDVNHSSLRSLRSNDPILKDISPSFTSSSSSSTIQDSHRFLEDGNDTKSPSKCATSSNPFSAVPLSIQIVLIVVLILFSALFSGLTLGLMGLDKTGLEIVMEGDNLKNAAAARKVYTVRKNGNLLLCTLLLGNVAVNALLSILLADKAGGIAGFLASTFLIVIFGEIVPQALCQRYSLQIGSRAVPLVKAVIVCLFPVTFPIAFILDKALGHELTTTYSSAEMKKLFEIHVKEGRFDQETGAAMAGALKYKDIAVKDVMTPLKNTFMLGVDEKLNFGTVATIFKTGYSRIPVYEISVNNIIGLLFVKDLIFIDPEDDTPVRNFVQIFGRGVHVVWPDDKLGEVLKELKQGRSHMALVRDVNNDNKEGLDPVYEIKGIITLEDIIEEIIGDEIVDETDAFVDGTHSVKVSRMQGFDWGRLKLLDAKILEETLSFEEARAVTAHLKTNYFNAVSLLSDKQLHRLVSETNVEELPTAEQEIGSSSGPDQGSHTPKEVLYQKGVPSDKCTLILSGKVTVIAGQDEFRSDVSSWSVLGAAALSQPLYTPDFTAFVSSGPCRCLYFTREQYTAAVDSSVLEKQSNTQIDLSSDGNKAAVVTRTSSGEMNATSIEHAHVAESRKVIQSRRNKLIAAMDSMDEPGPSFMESAAALFRSSESP